MRALSVPLLGLAIALGTNSCSHANRPCPPERPFAHRPPTMAPTDPTTAVAVTATGAGYGVCSPGSTYLLARPGERELTEQELRTVQMGIFHALPGMISGEIGVVRCLSPRMALGVKLEVWEQSVTPAQIAQQLATLAPEGAIARVEVRIISAPGPRCAPDDPACEPLPYRAECVEKTDYDPKGTRTIVRGGGGSCAHDGACTIGGCGNECVPTSEIPLPGTCELYTHWENVYCGCVQNACAWFTTK